MGKGIWPAGGLRDPAAPALWAWAPGLLGEVNVDGLFTVRPDCSLSRTRGAPKTVFKVCGELVGTPSDPS